ncbi:MAG: hypothetical protein ABIO44_08250 [Saprospiraceae bacterium]
MSNFKEIIEELVNSNIFYKNNFKLLPPISDGESNLFLLLSNSLDRMLIFKIDKRNFDNSYNCYAKIQNTEISVEYDITSLSMIKARSLSENLNDYLGTNFQEKFKNFILISFELCETKLKNILLGLEWEVSIWDGYK